MKTHCKSLLATTLALAGLAAMIAPTAQAQIVFGQPITMRTRGQKRASRPRTTTRRTTSNNKGAVSNTPRKRGPNLGDALAQLGLNDTQKRQVAGFQAKANADGRAVYDNRSISAEASIDQMGRINHTMLENIASVLTPAQKTKLISLLPELKNEPLTGDTSAAETTGSLAVKPNASATTTP
jgi:hypothetical protein